MFNNKPKLPMFRYIKKDEEIFKDAGLKMCVLKI